MSARQRQTSPEVELSEYFAGELEGAMGLRSWLGGWEDRGPARPSPSSASPPEPGMQALVAARAMQHIEGALALAGRRHALVLAARFSPRGPNARLGGYVDKELGDLSGVVLAPVLEADILAVFAEADEAALRAALRSGSIERAREASEFIAPERVADRIVALERAPLSAIRLASTRHARQLRARLKALAGRELAGALGAYVLARAAWARQARDERIKRYAGSLER